MVADVEELENFDESAQRKAGSHAETGRRIHILFRRWISQVCQKRSGTPKIYLNSGSSCKNWGAQWRSSRRVGRPLPSYQQTDDIKAWNCFWSISGNHIFRHHVDQRVRLCVPKDSQADDPTLYVYNESRKDDSWNVDGNRELSGSWKGSTLFTILNETPPNGNTCS